MICSSWSPTKTFINFSSFRSHFMWYSSAEMCLNCWYIWNYISINSIWTPDKKKFVTCQCKRRKRLFRLKTRFAQNRERNIIFLWLKKPVGWIQFLPGQGKKILEQSIYSHLHQPSYAVMFWAYQLGKLSPPEERITNLGPNQAQTSTWPFSREFSTLSLCRGSLSSTSV